ncbi:MAG TPA: PAS domain S-box protein [Nitrospirae bacterium]|nr:PAS domain S-box protein [Nitrospirota bacterium]
MKMDGFSSRLISRDYFQAIIDSMMDILIVTDADDRITFVNKTTCEYLGYSSEELLGRDVKTLFDGDPLDCLQFDEILERSSFKNIEKNIRTSSGRYLTLLISGSLVVSDDEVQSIVFIGKDITDLKRAEEKLKEYTEELLRKNKELQDFAYIASHDLQEPLRKIRAFGERLMRKYKEQLDEQGQDYLNRMINASERMQQLISGLLMYCRVTTKVQPFQKVDLNRIVNEVLSDLEIKIKEVKGTVSVARLHEIDADPLQMRQLFQNLIANALKFHKEDTCPIVEIESDIISDNTGREICKISVKDNGIGFDPGHSERIFGVFERLHGRSDYEGTGIGLAICKKIVERHGGTIKATAQENKGAEFIIRLPVRHEMDSGGS